MYIEYCILREGVPFSLKTIIERGGTIQFENYKKHHNRRKKKLLFVIYEEIEADNLDFGVKLDIQVPNSGKTPR